mgnify:CR=1 FL=1
MNNDKYGDKMKKCITLFDGLTDDERIIVMDGYNSSTGKWEKLKGMENLIPDYEYKPKQRR